MGFIKLKRPILGRFVYIMSEQSVKSTFLIKTSCDHFGSVYNALHRHRRQATFLKVCSEII